MKKSDLAKEASKIALSVVIVYWLGLHLGWMKPSWAAFAVVLVAVPGAAGQSIFKGTLRVLGTIPGGLAGLLILALAPSDRWLFIGITALWMFFATYRMLSNKKYSYLWNIAGITSLVVLLGGAGGESNAIFQQAIFRTIDTALGIIVYTLVTTFLWPANFSSKIIESAVGLNKLQSSILDIVMQFRMDDEDKQKIADLRKQLVGNLSSFSQTLVIEGTSTYRVYEVIKYWQKFEYLSAKLIDVTDRYINTLDDIEIQKAKGKIPALEVNLKLMADKFAMIQDRFGNQGTGSRVISEKLVLEEDAMNGLSNVEKTAITIILREQATMDRLLDELVDCVEHLTNDNLSQTKPKEIAINQKQTLAFDIDNVRGALYVAITTALGYLVWIYVDPPGHVGWLQLPGAIAMVVAGMPQLKANLLIKPITIFSIFGILVYIFILPKLDNFFELGLLFFTLLFLSNFLLKGLGALSGNVGILGMIAIQNQQIYSFPALANSLLFLIIGFSFVFATSFILSSARPEKVVISLAKRFFKNAVYLISEYTGDTNQKLTWLGRLQHASAYYQVKTLPRKILAWGSMIDSSKYPENSAKQAMDLMLNLESLAFRVEQVLETHVDKIGKNLRIEISDVIGKWKSEFEEIFEQWAKKPEYNVNQDLKTDLDNLHEEMETWLDKLASDGSLGEAGEEESIQFYQLVGGFRGVSQAIASYGTSTNSYSWEEWKEEKF